MSPGSVSLPGVAGTGIHRPVAFGASIIVCGLITVAHVPEERQSDRQQDALFDADTTTAAAVTTAR